MLNVTFGVWKWMAMMIHWRVKASCFLFAEMEAEVAVAVKSEQIAIRCVGL